MFDKMEFCFGENIFVDEEVGEVVERVVCFGESVSDVFVPREVGR